MPFVVELSLSALVLLVRYMKLMHSGLGIRDFDEFFSNAGLNFLKSNWLVTIADADGPRSG